MNTFYTHPELAPILGTLLGVIVYRLLTKGQAWVDRGVAMFEQKRKTLNLASLEAGALASGFRLVPVTAA